MTKIGVDFIAFEVAELNTDVHYDDKIRVQLRQHELGVEIIQSSSLVSNSEIWGLMNKELK